MLAPWRIFYLALVIFVAADPKNSTTATSSPVRTNHTSTTSTETITTLPEEEEEEDNVNEVDAEYEIYYQDYVVKRIDTSPTYVTPVEKFIQTLIGPLINQGRNEDQSGLGAIISGITKPIRDIVKPVVNSRSFGDVLNLIGDRFKAIYPGKIVSFL